MNSHQYSFIEIIENIPIGKCYNVKQNDHKCQVECPRVKKSPANHAGESLLLMKSSPFRSSIMIFFNLCTDQNKSFTGWMACAVEKLLLFETL